MKHDRIRITLLFQRVAEVGPFGLLQQIVVCDEGGHHELGGGLHQICMGGFQSDEQVQGSGTLICMAVWATVATGHSCHECGDKQV